MEVVLHSLGIEVCFVYLADIVVVGATWEEHLANLTTVLDRIRRVGLKLKPKKCEFTQAEVLYLGHVASSEGVRTDPAKLATV